MEAFRKADSKIIKLLKDKKGIFSTEDAEQAGISRTTLVNLTRDGKIERVANGWYIHPDDFLDELYILQQRSGKIVFSHETAMFLHDMAERTPLKHSVTIPSSC